MPTINYKANITAGGLLVPESRKIAHLLLSSPDSKQWKVAIEQENILQKRSVATASRIAALIRVRLELMKKEFWKMVAEGDSLISTHAVFASAIKHCRLLGDFLDLVVREQFRNYEDKLTCRLWDDYIEGCKQRDPAMNEFPPTTAAKVRSNVFKILCEAGYLKNRRSMELQRISIAYEVVEYLERNNESYVLKCIQI
jgi:hypothetical protein